MWLGQEAIRSMPSTLMRIRSSARPRITGRLETPPAPCNWTPGTSRSRLAVSLVAGRRARSVSSSTWLAAGTGCRRVSSMTTGSSCVGCSLPAVATPSATAGGTMPLAPSTAIAAAI
jgi:hypothetical protein